MSDNLDEGQMNDAGTAPAQTSAAAPADPVALDIDRLSLEQALLDFDVANARVLDLTHRLVELGVVNRSLHTQLEQLRLEYAELRSEYERTMASGPFRIAERIWMIRNALRR
jgi:hypothetical protein